MQQIRHNYKRCQHCRQNIAIGTEEEKKWTEEETDTENLKLHSGAGRCLHKHSNNE